MWGVLLVALGLFASRKRANRRLNRLHAKGKVQRLGMVEIVSGERTPKLGWHCLFYCGVPFGRNMNQHHAEVTAFKWGLDADSFERWGVEGEADGKVTIGEDVWLYEHDRGTENNAQLKARVAKLAQTGFGVLWTAHTPARLAKLKRLTEPIKDDCLYALYRNALTPHEDVWQFHDGTWTALPRSSGEDRGEVRSPNASRGED